MTIILCVLAIAFCVTPVGAQDIDDDQWYLSEYFDDYVFEDERRADEESLQQQQQQQQRSSRRRERRTAARQREWFVRSINFSGNDTYNKNELISIMDLKPRRWRRSNVRFTNFIMNADLEALRIFYRGRGFEYADVQLDRIDMDSTSRQVRMHIVIDEGPRVHVGEIYVIAERVTLRPSEMRRLLTKVDNPLIHSEIRQDCRTLTNILGHRGFLAADVVPDVLIDPETNLAQIIFRINEGPKVAVARHILEGHEGIKRSVVRRELVFSGGDTLNLKMIQQSERRLYSTGLFNFVQVEPMFDTARAAVDQPDSAYDVRVRVNLSDFFRLQGRVGYSTDEGFMAAAAATYMNMFGRGQPLTLDGRISQMMHGAEALYTIPGLFFMPFSFNTKLYYTGYHNAEHYQGAFTGIRLSIDQRADYHILYQIWTQWERLEWIRVPAAEHIGSHIPEQPTQSIGGNIGYDSRDNLFNPTSGSFTNIELEIAGLFGGNYNQFVKLGFDTRRYFHYRSRYFLSTALRTGWVTPYGNSEVVPIQSRFYGGGSSTVRGFPVNKLAVLPGDLPLLGNFYTFINIADIRFPIYWWVNGAVFLDAGNVWPDFTDIKSAKDFFDDLRWSAGPGLRIDTPIKLVARLDMGFKLDRRPGESKWELHFDLGQPF
jgi:outer membrane protein insertion porin family